MLPKYAGKEPTAEPTGANLWPPWSSATPETQREVTQVGHSGSKRPQVTHRKQKDVDTQCFTYQHTLSFIWQWLPPAFPSRFTQLFKYERAGYSPLSLWLCVGISYLGGLEQGLAIAETAGLLERFNGARVESRASVCFQSFPGDSPMQAELKPTDTTSSRSAVISTSAAWSCPRLVDLWCEFSYAHASPIIISVSSSFSLSFHKV